MHCIKNKIKNITGARLKATSTIVAPLCVHTLGEGEIKLTPLPYLHELLVRNVFMFLTALVFIQPILFLLLAMRYKFLSYAGLGVGNTVGGVDGVGVTEGDTTGVAVTCGLGVGCGDGGVVGDAVGIGVGVLVGAGVAVSR